jgi:hypothetical protein
VLIGFNVGSELYFDTKKQRERITLTQKLQKFVCCKKKEMKKVTALEFQMDFVLLLQFTILFKNLNYLNMNVCENQLV